MENDERMVEPGRVATARGLFVLGGPTRHSATRRSSRAFSLAITSTPASLASFHVPMISAQSGIFLSDRLESAL
jgi:hypothetical protein